MGHDLRARGERLFSTDAAGYIGYAAGPSVHLVDRYGLGDPLLARLPAEVPWRMGHFVRHVPGGYIETLETGRDQILDPAIGAYYEKLRIITEGAIWSRERWRTIWRMQLGEYDHFIASYELVRLPLDRAGGGAPDGTDPRKDDDATEMTLRGVIVELGGPRTARAIDVSVSRNDRYRIALLSGGVEKYVTRLDQPMSGDGTLISHLVEIPHDLAFDTVLISPSGGDSRYFFGHMKLVP
jgi:arabinofuranosyltransferase